MYFLLLQIFLFNLVNSEFFIPWHNVTLDTTSQIAGRAKRSPVETLPIRLHIEFKYGSDEKITLKLRKTYTSLANEFLPVFVSLTNERSEVMKNFGEFIAFYDIPQCCAVIYFQKTNSFYGIIGTDYYIENLPYHFDRNGNYLLPMVGEPYLKKRQFPLNHINPQNFIPQMSTSNFRDDSLRQSDNFSEIDNNNIDNDSTENAQNTQNIPNFAISNSIYVFEIVIFVARDIANNFLGHYGPNHYIEWIVRYYIVYFNAIDMIFKSIFALNGNVRINIAKICIETNSKPFSFLNNDILRYSDVVAKLPIFFSTFSEDHPEDSFDYVFIHTSRAIWDGPVRRAGATKRSNDLTDARKNNRFYSAVPVTIMGYEYFFADYITTVQAIGGIFNMSLESPTRGLTENGQCYSIMQIGGARCHNCLQWSEDSRNQLNIFLSTNPNRCFLVNYPRSLKKPGPCRLYTPYMQCKCYGYDGYRTLNNGRGADSILMNDCTESLFCENHVNGLAIPKQTSILPFDGTSCGNKKVCWNKQCVVM